MAKGQSRASTERAGPPMLLLGLGFASILVSLPLVAFDSIPPRLVGYVTGSLIPILVLGFVRRIDLDRRQSPSYRPRAALKPAVAALAVLAIVAAGLHVWPIATELAS
jgi:hypothetical protein